MAYPRLPRRRKKRRYYQYLQNHLKVSKQAWLIECMAIYYDEVKGCRRNRLDYKKQFRYHYIDGEINLNKKRPHYADKYSTECTNGRREPRMASNKYGLFNGRVSGRAGRCK